MSKSLPEVVADLETRLAHVEKSLGIDIDVAAADNAASLAAGAAANELDTVPKPEPVLEEHPDGSTTLTVHNADGSIAVTDTDPDGTATVTLHGVDGSVTTTHSDGSTTVVDADGNTTSTSAPAA